MDRSLEEATGKTFDKKRIGPMGAAPAAAPEPRVSTVNFTGR
jgi:hypothetical protein